MVAQGLPWPANVGAVAGTVTAQWTLSVGQRRHSGGTKEAEASLKLEQNAYTSTIFSTGQPVTEPPILCPR